MLARPTLFRVLVQERRWDSWSVFACHLERAARDLARTADAPQLAGVSVARRTFDRWMAGKLRDMPQHGHRVVLEHLLGFPCLELFGPSPVASGSAHGENDPSQPYTGQGGTELTARQLRRVSQYDVAMLTLDERRGG